MVALEALERIGERSGAAGRAQPHVDLVEPALVGVGGERRHDLGAEPRVVLRRRQRLRDRRKLPGRAGCRRRRSGRGRRSPTSRGCRACPCPARPAAGRGSRHASRRSAARPCRTARRWWRRRCRSRRRPPRPAARSPGAAGRPPGSAGRWPSAAPDRGCPARDRPWPVAPRDPPPFPAPRAADDRRRATAPHRAAGVRRARWAARPGALPMIAATSSSSAGLALNSEKSWMPAGRLPRKRSKFSSAWSGAAVDAQRLQQAGHQFGQKLAGARRRRGAVAAVMPAPHDAGRRRGIAEAQASPGSRACRDRRRCR